MGEVVKRGVIGAPGKAVFNYVADPHNAPHYISSIKRIIAGPDGHPRQGDTWKAEAVFLGKPAVINLRLVELRPSELVRFALQGEPQAEITVELSPGPDRNHTRVALQLEVPSVPGLFLNALMGGLLEGDLSRLKEILET